MLKQITITFVLCSITCFNYYDGRWHFPFVLAYGDHGIVFTAIAAQVDEDYQNIVSVPTTPMEIDNKMEKYPGFNFGVSMISSN